MPTFLETAWRRFYEPHLANPSGLLGRYVAGKMNQANGGITRFCLDSLGVEESQQILEIGFGGGVSFDLVLPLLGQGTLHGLDRSPDVLRWAKGTHARDLAGGRLDLRLGQVDRLPYADASMDRAFGVNTLYFWPDPLAGLKELRRVLRPGGRLALALRARSVFDRVGYSKRIFRVYEDDELMELLGQAGFTDTEVRHTLLGKADTLVALGSKSGPARA